MGALLGRDDTVFVSLREKSEKTIPFCLRRFSGKKAKKKTIDKLLNRLFFEGNFGEVVLIAKARKPDAHGSVCEDRGL